jgi:hypothetical protein
MELFDANNVVIWRAMERLINVLIGALAIFLGYRLFMNLPERREDQEGKMKLLLPGDISVYVSRVGPGVFFALFGTAIVLTSFVKTLTLAPALPAAKQEQAAPAAEAPPPAQTAMLSYVSGAIDTNRYNTDRAAVQRDLLTLRKLEAAVNQSLSKNQPISLSDNDSATLLSTLPRIKRALLLDVWDQKWGDQQAFSRWVQEGAFGPPPTGVMQVDMYFKPLDTGGSP